MTAVSAAHATGVAAAAACAHAAPAATAADGRTSTREGCEEVSLQKKSHSSDQDLCPHASETSTLAVAFIAKRFSRLQIATGRAMLASKTVAAVAAVALPRGAAPRAQQPSAAEPQQQRHHSGTAHASCLHTHSFITYV